MHLHNTASLRLFGDSEASIRLVPALHGVFAVIMLFFFVRRFWGDLHAVLAAAVYLVFPINLIYSNMMNHSSGFIAWSLLFLYCYLSYHEARDAGRPWVRWHLGLLGAFFMAGMWDWPAYYVALITAFHWFFHSIMRQKRAGRPWWMPGLDVLLLASFCILVLANFGGHFLLVKIAMGSIKDIEGTIRNRWDLAWGSYFWHLRHAPRLLFTIPILAICAAWLIALLVRLARRRTRARDLMLLVYAAGGITHYAIFKWSAFAHCYWAWTLMPFMAVAVADTVIWLGRLPRRFLVKRFMGPWPRRIGTAMGLAACLLLLPLLLRSIDLVPRGRSVGGSMWFLERVRGNYIETYNSGRPELRFARFVKQRTNRSTGVLVHRSFNSIYPECRFDITMDREIMYVNGLPKVLPDRAHLPEGWVFIGIVERFSRHRIARLAAKHPYAQYGKFFLLDLRRTGIDAELYRLEPRPMNFAWRYLVSPFEGPIEPVRMTGMEEAFLEEIASVKAIPQRAPKKRPKKKQPPVKLHPSNMLPRTH
ncbi:MAG: glycosyltransferase family 39 protein [Deltaproteobacteria bacterium]|nr:glycosyltransferase family 39 protein [Deltaproteobacteria bacterium]